MSVDNFFQVKISNKIRNDYNGPNGTSTCWKWALDNFGSPGQTPNGFRWQWNTYNTFYFRDEADATLFALKWS